MAALLATATFAFAQQGPDPMDDVLSNLGLTGGEIVDLEVVATEPGTTIAAFDLGGVPIFLDLEESSLRAETFQVLEQQADGSWIEVLPRAPRTVRGEVLGVPGSAVAGSLLDDGLHARIRLPGTEDYWLEPLNAELPFDAVGHILYRDDDVIDPDRMCGTDFLPLDQPVGTPNGAGSSEAAALQVAELACDADFEYFTDYGSTSAVVAQIESVVATTNLQYESEVGITHTITTILVRSALPQPYTSTDAVTLLNQFRDEWNANQGAIQRDMAQLFTGKEIDGGTIGIAWVGVVCNLSFGYSMVQSDFNNNFSCATDLTAHELGHNWNAGHCSCSSNTMNPFITCANTFHPTFTIPTITSFRDSRTCLDDGGPDVTPPAAPSGLVAAAGDGTVSLDWNDNGEGDLAGYSVYRSLTPGGPYARLNGALLGSSSYVDSSVSNGTTYYYVVTAEDTSANESAGSNEVSATPQAGGGGPTTLHVASILPGTFNVGRGFKGAQAVVVIEDDLGGPVSGATVSVSFTGDLNDADTGVTDASGSVTLATTGTKKGKLQFTVCVGDVTHAALTYQPADNVETCDSP